jgi:hypothetical protein
MERLIRILRHWRRESANFPSTERTDFLKCVRRRQFQPGFASKAELLQKGTGMKRDMDLMRDLLLEIEANDAVATPPPEDIETVGHHLILLTEAGLIAGLTIEHSSDGRVMWYFKTVPRLTWEGHEFVDAARSNVVWNEARASISSKVDSVSLALLKQMLNELAAQQLGLKP